MSTAGAIVRPESTRAGETREGTARRERKRTDGVTISVEADPKSFSGEDRYRMIAEAAYFRAEMRGFHPGNELDDWLAAEVEVDELLGETAPAGSA